MYLLLYFLSNLFYSSGGKNIPLVDVSILSLSYLLRVLYGGSLINTEVSEWMFLTVLSAALFLSFGKRRNELVMYGTEKREILKKYNREFLDKSMYMSLSLLIVFYALSCADKTTTVAESGVDLVWSVPAVILIFLRYCSILESGKSDGDPVEVVCRDKVLLWLMGAYSMVVLWLLYF